MMEEIPHFNFNENSTAKYSQTHIMHVYIKNRICVDLLLYLGSFKGRRFEKLMKDGYLFIIVL